MKSINSVQELVDELVRTSVATGCQLCGGCAVVGSQLVLSSTTRAVIRGCCLHCAWLQSCTAGHRLWIDWCAA
jgi:hypothetical protein